MANKFIICAITMAIANIAAATCPVAPANMPSVEANQLAINKLGQFFKCAANDPLNDQSPCNTFASRGLEAIYGVMDFKTADNKHLSANQMWDKVNAPGSKWAKLGKVFDEDNNLCAQSMTNSAWPVIALMRAVEHGHVALIIPGEPKKSNSWNMLAANSASFFLGKPDSVYLNKPISSAFGPDNAKQAVFFYRKP